MVVEDDRQRLVEGVAALFPAMSLDEQRVSISLYRLLAQGRAVSRGRLAEAAALPEATVSEMLARWRTVSTERGGKITAYEGLTLSETEHRFLVEGRALFTWCAWDSLFLPQILDRSARALSTCPVSGEPIRIDVGRSGVETIEPAGAVLSFVVPKAHLRGELRAGFCRHVRFYRSAKDAARRTAGREHGFLMTIVGGERLGREKNALQYPDLLPSRERGETEE